MSSDLKLPDNVVVPPESIMVTCTAPVNIAVVKYWGKRDEKLILPINSSLSATLDQGSMKASTIIIASKSYERTQMWLNHKEENVPASKRLNAVIQALLERAHDVVVDGKTVIRKEDWPAYKLHIISVNNFPTAAGLASSAAGLACFARCLAEVYHVKEAYPGELSIIARIGSGSACRSMYGGFVRWNMGTDPTGRDSIAEQVIDEHYWPEMRVLILVARNTQKETSSTDGMQRSVVTSDLLRYRAEHLVPRFLAANEAALKARDFDKFAELTIRDSNQFHAVCLDTYPPLFYMNESSKHVTEVIDALNNASGRMVAAYTFDAGPNACLYLLEKDLHTVLNVCLEHFQPTADATTPEGWLYDPMQLLSAERRASEHVAPAIAQQLPKRRTDVSIKQIIATKVGGGPCITAKQITFA